MSAKELKYIDLNKRYVLNNNGNTEPDVQTLSLNRVIEDAKIYPAILLAENNEGSGNYQRYQPQTHHYYVFSTLTNTYVIEDGNDAENLPNYLTGWQYLYNGDLTQFSEIGNTVDSTLVETYFSSDTNLNLYASWGNTRFVRVIVSPFNENVHSDGGTFSVTIHQQSSYATLPYPLSDAFKRTVDYSNVNKHSFIKVDNGAPGNYDEFGTGDGCKQNIGGAWYPSYFGVKDGTSPSVSLSITNSNFIPEYTYNNTLVYKAHVCETGLSRNFQSLSTPTELAYSNGTWTISSLGSMSSDKTVFIRLRQKPTITATVCNTGTGKIEITTTSSQPSIIDLNEKTMTFMPGDNCILWAQPSTGYLFDGWYSDSNASNPVPDDSLGNPYTSVEYHVNPIKDTTTFYAKFVSSNYTITFLKTRNNL